MDDLDQQLLLLLGRDGRASAADLARALSVSRGTIQNRIAKLKRDGVIKRFTVELSEKELSQQVSAFVLINLKATDDAMVKVALRKFKEITVISTLSGSFDMVAEIRCSSLARLDDLLDQIRCTPNVQSTQSHIRLRTLDN
ncbi:Lrp/AsnC family transcriptional regulator [Leucothrix sargassi]|nr:Lrp/AsnC family transcriptional regulator [Leucothrix sargassi]